MPLTHIYHLGQRLLSSKLSILSDKIDQYLCQKCDGRLRCCCCRRMRWFNHYSFRIFTIILLLVLGILSYRCSYLHLQAQLNPTTQPNVRIMYVVRTVSKYHSTRLVHLLETWIPLVHEHVFFVSDTFLPNITQTHIIPTETTCGPTSHSVRSLCCQTIHDFVLYRRHQSQYDWFCHFDDDQYVHVHNLHEYLSTLDPSHSYYIGRNSWDSTFKRKKNPHPHNFWFATLGAGVCLSKRTVHLLEPYTRTTSQFIDGCLREFYPDDIYLGFLLNNHLNISLTKNLRFHSHLERSLFNDKYELIDALHQQITFGFRLPEKMSRHIPYLFPKNIDPLRMRSLHCLLYTYVKDCQQRVQKYILNTTR